MSRMTDTQERERADLENALAELGVMRVEIQLARLRVEQARRRFPATEWLLGPVAAYVDSWDRRLSTTQQALSEEWKNGNRTNWKTGS